MHRSDEAMNSSGNFPKICYFRSKAKKHCCLCLTYVLESFALFYGDLCMDLYSVDRAEALKQ
jgi:hypothetical protein